jgi:uncharacterized membrane protein required for colicin V production
MSMEIQILDVVVVLVIIASTAYATYRGFVDETLKIVSWAAAALATLYFGPWIAAMMRHVMQPAWLGAIAGYVAVFLVVLIPFSFMTFRLSRNVKKSQVGPLDASLGAAFGVVRGLAIVGIAYLLFTMIVPISSQPGWVTKAELLPMIRGSAEVIASLVPDQHVKTDEPTSAAVPPPLPNAEAPKKNAAVPAESQDKTAQPAAEPTKKTITKKHTKKTYGAKDRKALDKLIETTDDGKSGKP